MTAMKHNSVLVISFSDLARDPRVNRQVRTLAGEYSVAFAGFGTSDMPAVEFIELTRFPVSLLSKARKVYSLLGRRHESFYWGQAPVRSALEQLQGRHFDMVVANDIDSLPLALKIAGGAPVYFDAHEYHPREFEDRASWRLLYQPYKQYLCARYLQKARTMTTVCKGIANEYEKEYGVRVGVVLNVPDYQELTPSVVEAGRIRLIHHGAAIPSRNLEVMIDMFAHLDNRFSLDFMLVPSNRTYLDSLIKRAACYPSIRFVNPVPMNKIVEAINNYDVGVYILPPSSFNNEHALPNKLFEFIQARLGIAIGPSPEMAQIVVNHRLGVVAKSFSAVDLADSLNKLTMDDVRVLKSRAANAAREFCFESNAEKIRGLARETLNADQYF